jgi:hypothetical protein
MYKILQTAFFTFLALLFSTTSAYSFDNFWKLEDPKILLNQTGERKVIASKFKLFSLSLDNFDDFIRSAADRDDYLGREQGIEISLPTPDGGFQRFSLVYDPIMHVSDQVRFPEIRTYTGWGIDDSSAFLKCDITTRGFHAFILSDKHPTWFIDPIFWDSKNLYQAYDKEDYLPKEGDFFECSLKKNPNLDSLGTSAAADRSGDCQKRTYRLALACTGEYATFHGGATQALAAMNTTMNRVNGVFEREFSVRMNLIANNSSIIYTNGATDPYTNNDGYVMLDENQTNIDNVIGFANYDVGHVFSTGGGGVAFLGCLCSSIKAEGVTGRGNPIGDGFDIDYVAHEMGHQLGANHTFNANTGSCNGNVNLSTDVEPGSGTTIMAYAGICGTNNVQSTSNDYFSHASITEIYDYLIYYGCGVTTTPPNAAPTANAGLDYTIPKSTAFTLTGAGTDANGDPISFCWEQNDANLEISTPPTTTQSTGAVIRSFSPTSSTSRTIPKYVPANTYPNNITWEVLPSVTRSLNFRLTVRDNHTSGGCTAEDNMVVNVEGNSGPFVLNVPSNPSIVWPANSSQTVSWNAANTNFAPVNCSNVDILLSTDGGLTFPTTLATNRPNIGTAFVNVPNTPTTTARIQVKASNNIFFDISNNNFQISIAFPVELLKFTAKSQKDAIQLSWSTATESNNKGYDVQRSTKSASDFETIGFVKGFGNSYVQQNYQFVDTKAEKGTTYFYRLKQNDFDTKFHLSDIVSANLSANLFDFSINPNPARESAVIQLKGVFEEYAPLKISLMDAQGKIVNEENGTCSQDSYDFSLQNIHTGLYFLNIQTEKGTAVKKLWKL